MKQATKRLQWVLRWGPRFRRCPDKIIFTGIVKRETLKEMQERFNG